MNQFHTTFATAQLSKKGRKYSRKSVQPLPITAEIGGAFDSDSDDLFNE